MTKRAVPEVGEQLPSPTDHLRPVREIPGRGGKADTGPPLTKIVGGSYGGNMLRVLTATLFLALASSAWGRSYDVAFRAGLGTAPVQQAVRAIREATQLRNVPISTISAALIDLNGDGSPELFVQLTGGFCGSGGCDIMLFERGTGGWIKIGDWLAGYVSVTDTRDGGWLQLMLDHTRIWRHGAAGYELLSRR